MARSRARRPAVFVGLVLLPAVIVLVGLGSWQLQRLAWKQGLIEVMQERLGAASVTFDQLLTAPDPQAWDYRRVTASGRYLDQTSLLIVPRTRKGIAGGHLLTVFESADGHHVLVNRGWVPTADGDAARLSYPARDNMVTGIVRVPGHSLPATRGPFVPRNEPANGAWYWIDIAAMADSLGLALLPLVVEADAYPDPDPNRLPVGGVTRLDVPNNHLQYAMTWFALAAAAALIGMLMLHNAARDRREMESG